MKNNNNEKTMYEHDNNINLQLFYNKIEELKFIMNKKEDDIKNIINEKDAIIEQLNERIINQERRIQNNENEIKKLNIKLKELNELNENKLKEKEDKINAIHNTITKKEKEIKNEIKTEMKSVKSYFKSDISSFKMVQFLRCFSNKSFKDRIYNELSKVKILEEKYGFLSSIGIKLIFPENDNEIEGFIKAPENSPYKNGIFNFMIKYDQGYPKVRPILFIKTKILHCNLPDNGICYYDLIRYWREDYDLSLILCSLYEFFVLNNPDDGIQGKVMRLYKTNYSLFEQKCQEYVNQYAYKEFYEGFLYLFDEYYTMDKNFSISDSIFVSVENNLEEIIIPKDKLKDKYTVNSNFSMNFGNKAFINGNKVFLNLSQIQELNHQIIFIAPKIRTY